MPGLLPISESAAEGILSDYDSAITSDSEDEERSQRESNTRASIFEWQDPFAHLTFEEVEAQLTQQTAHNHEKKRETEMYEGYLERHREREEARKIEMRKASRIAMGAEAEEAADAAEMAAAAKEKSASGIIKVKGSRRRSRRSGIKTISSKETAPLTLKSSEKIHIASDKLTEVERRTEFEEESLETVVANAAATTDEYVEQINAIEQYARRFDRWVLGKKDYHGRYASERWAQYAKERRQLDATQADELHERQAVTRSRLKKAAKTLAQEDRMDQVTPVDFEQERIKNTQYNEVLDMSAREVVEHKRMVMDATVQMNRQMHDLKVTNNVNDDLDGSIERLMRMETRLSTEMGHIQSESERLKLTQADLKSQVDTYKAPSVTEFLEYVTKLNLAHANLNIWTRKVKIAEIANRTHKVAWRTAKVEAARIGYEIASSKSSYGGFGSTTASLLDLAM